MSRVYVKDAILIINFKHFTTHKVGGGKLNCAMYIQDTKEIYSDAYNVAL